MSGSEVARSSSIHRKRRDAIRTIQVALLRFMLRKTEQEKAALLVLEKKLTQTMLKLENEEMKREQTFVQKMNALNDLNTVHQERLALDSMLTKERKKIHGSRALEQRLKSDLERLSQEIKMLELDVKLSRSRESELRKENASLQETIQRLQEKIDSMETKQVPLSLPVAEESSEAEESSQASVGSVHKPIALK